MLVRWNLTVCSVTQSSLPIAWLERCLGQVVLECVAGCFGAVGDAELAVDVGEVEFDGLFGDPELFADCLVGEVSRPSRARMRSGLLRCGWRRRACGRCW